VPLIGAPAVPARRLLDGLYRASLALAGVFLLGVFGVMLAETALRYFGSFVPGANEIVGWCCAAAGFLALPATFKRGDMVRVDALLKALPAPARKALALLCLTIAALATAYLLWATARYLHAGWRSDETTQGMIEIAVWIPQLSALVGVALLLVAVLDEWVSTARGANEPLSP
jgi:TRAP-type C4-dicarboxylate transport system permease small subunit